MKTYSFSKEERLSSRKCLDALFSEGRLIQAGPIRVYWKKETSGDRPFPARIAIGVPKKKIRKATDRNLIKRRIREAYRKHKQILYDFLKERSLFVHLFILYQEDRVLSYREIEQKVVVLINRLMKENEKNPV